MAAKKGRMTAGEMVDTLAGIGFDVEEKTADRIRALELCGKLLGLFDIERREAEEGAAQRRLTMQEKVTLIREAANSLGQSESE